MIEELMEVGQNLQKVTDKMQTADKQELQEIKALVRMIRDEADHIFKFVNHKRTLKDFFKK